MYALFEDGRIKNVGEVFTARTAPIKMGETILQLLDCKVVVWKDKKVCPLILYPRDYDSIHLAEDAVENIFGAVWLSTGLKYVAKEFKDKMMPL